MEDRYLQLSLLVILSACLPYAFAYKQRPKRHVGAVLTVMVALTAIFDPLIIAAGIVSYDERFIMGLTWLGAPLEDFSYAIAAALLMPFLWKLAKGKPREI